MGSPTALSVDIREADVSSTSRSFSTRLFISYSYFLGVDMRSIKERPVKKSLFTLKNLYRAFFVASLITFMTGKLLSFHEVFRSDPGMLKVIEATYFANAVLIMAETQRAAYVNENFLREFFRPENLKYLDYRRIYFLLVTSSVYLTMDVYVAFRTNSTIAVASYVAAVFAWNLQTLYFLLHTQSIATVLGQLRALRYVEKRKQALDEKARIRRDIARINETFGNVAFFICLKLFSFLYQSIVRTMISLSTDRTSIYLVIFPFMQLLTLYDMANLSTQASDICHESTTDFLGNETCGLETWRTYQVMKYDRTRDNFNILNTFAFHKGTFLTYVATVLTFIGIVVQFDYKVIDLFDHAKASASNNQRHVVVCN